VGFASALTCETSVVSIGPGFVAMVTWFALELRV
jgi:hypothetical protein